MKRIIPLTALLICFLQISSGCQRDLTKQVTKPTKKEVRLARSEIISVYNPHSNDVPSLFVRHRVLGNKVFVECLVTGISFRQAEESKEKKGKMIVWIDDKRKQEVTSAAFIIKGISPGPHKIKLEVVTLGNDSYGLTNEFLVNIPKL